MKLATLKDSFLRMLRDEQGDEGVNKVLIIAMIVIPLVLVLIFFGDEIVDFFKGEWEGLRDEETEPSWD